MSKACLRSRADPRSTRERRDETIPFGFTSRQAQPQPTRVIRKDSGPDFRLGELHLRRLGAARLKELEQRCAADEFPTRRPCQSIEPQRLTGEPHPGLTGPILIAQGASSDLDRRARNRPRS